MKTIIKKIASLSTLGVLFCISLAHAEIPILNTIKASTTNSASTLGYKANNQDIILLILSMIKYAIGLLAIVFFGFLIYYGIDWMTAGGNEDKVKKAKLGLTRMLKGFAVILGAYIITTFIVPEILKTFIK